MPRLYFCTLRTARLQPVLVVIQSRVMDRERILIRPATIHDIPDIVRLRRGMFEAMGYGNGGQLDSVDAACEAYFSHAIQAGRYQGWLASTSEGKAIASGGLVVDEHPPGPDNLSGRIGYVMNLYTDPAYRRRGIARNVMGRIMERIQSTGITVAALHATDVGRPLYDQFGFAESNEVRAGV